MLSACRPSFVLQQAESRPSLVKDAGAVVIRPCLKPSCTGAQRSAMHPVCRNKAIGASIRATNRLLKQEERPLVTARADSSAAVSMVVKRNRRTMFVGFGHSCFGLFTTKRLQSLQHHGSKDYSNFTMSSAASPHYMRFRNRHLVLLLVGHHPYGI